MKIFELFGSILIENDKANKSLESSESKAKKFASSLGNGLKTATKFGVGVGAAVGAAGTAMYGMATKAAEATDRIDKMSQKLGFSREGFQEWEFILSQSGASIDGMKTGMNKLTTTLDDFRSGSKTASEAFERIGLSMSDVEGLSQEDLFETVVMQLQDVSDESERAALAQDLLGRAGSELAPLLNAGANSIYDMKEQAHELGLVMSDDAVDAGVEFTDIVDQMTRSFKTAATGIGVTLMPVIKAGAKWVIDHMPQIQAFVQKAFNIISEVVQIAFDIFNDYFLPVIKTLYDWVLANIPTMQEYWTVFFETAKAVIDEVWTFIRDNWLPILESVYAFIQDNFPAIKATFENVFNLAIEVITALWEIMKVLWEFIEPTFPLIGDIIEGAFNTVIDIVNGVIDTFETLVGWIRTAIDWLDKFDRKDASVANGNLSGDLRQYTDGSHAGGLSYVPFDGYIAQLHKGERVITAEENRQLAMAGSPITVNTMIVRNDDDINRIARELRRLQVEEDRRRGG